MAKTLKILIPIVLVVALIIVLGGSLVVTKGAQVLIGGNDSYIAMCHKCWRAAIRKQEERNGD